MVADQDTSYVGRCGGRCRHSVGYRCTSRNKVVATKGATQAMELRRERIERLVTELNRRPFSQQTLALQSVDLALQSTQLRGSGQMEQVEIDKDVKVLNLKLMLPGDEHPKYSVVVKTVDGNKLLTVDDLLSEKKQGGSTVLVRVPTEVLPTNDYQLDLTGLTLMTKLRFLPSSSA